MNAIILAGGKGERLLPLTKDCPKCMLSFGSFTPIERLVHQLNHCKQIVIIVSYLGDIIKARLEDNPKIKFITKTCFLTNANRYSLLLGLEHLKDSRDDICVFEADMVAENDLINYVTGTDFEEHSTWFVSGNMKHGMSGGVIKTDGKNKITGIKYIENPIYPARPVDSNFYKMMGILRINEDKIKSFYRSLYWYCKRKGFLGYYLDAISHLPIYMGDASHYVYKAFNTLQEYLDAKTIDFDSKEVKKEIEEVKTKDLVPIERHKSQRFCNIDCSEPIKIEGNHNLILDGHHRYNICKKDGKRFMRVIKFDYSEVDVWSLREEIKLTKDQVINNALNKKLYPYKTVKHKFPKVVIKE